MTEAAAALIERTERMLRQAALDRTLVRLAALNRLLGETRLGAAPPRRTVSGGSSDAAALSLVEAPSGAQPVTAAATSTSPPLRVEHTIEPAQADIARAAESVEPERTTVPNVPTLPLRRPHVVAPVRLVGATPPAIEAVSTAMPGAAESGAPEARAPEPAGLLAAPGLRRPRGRAPMVTLADPGAPSAGVHAEMVDATAAASPQLPALERASDSSLGAAAPLAALAIPTGARSAVPTGPQSTTPTEAAPTMPGAGSVEVVSPSLHHQVPQRRATIAPPTATQAQTPPPTADSLPAGSTADLANVTPDVPATIIDSAPPGADLRWLADRLERLLRDEARAHGIFV